MTVEDLRIEGKDDGHTYRLTGRMIPAHMRGVVIVCRTCKETLLEADGPVTLEMIEVAVANHG